MSSFIGVYGKNKDLKSSINKLVPNPAFCVEHENLYLCSGEESLNTHFESNSETDSGWISCGIGISSGDAPYVLQQQDWTQAFTNNIDLHKDLNGHFAVVKWDINEIKLFTDQLGMRNIFIHQAQDFVLFSTRFDWMLCLVKETSVNWKLFGSNWLSINPFSSSCFINEIDRLAQGGYACISKSKMLIENKRWSPEPFQATEKSIISSLKGFSLAAMNSFSKTSLGLSGGLDSRVLFALMASQKRSDFDLYTFEVKGHPDVEYASRLNQSYNFGHKIIPMEASESDQILSEVEEITTRSLLASSIFNIEALNGYKLLGQQKAITIDGASGEIGRRRFLRGLELKARKNIIDNSLSELIPHFSVNKADIFTDDITQEMNIGFTEEFTTELDVMPSADEIGVGNWIDLLTIRSRIQNLSGLKQDAVDERLVHIMPFLQPNLLNGILSLPESERRNANLYRNIIHGQASSLTKIPLVKGDDIYPFWMKDLPSLAWIKAKRKLGLGYKNIQNIELIFSLEEYIRDTFDSSSVIQQPFYDKKKINSLINRFFDEKDTSLASQLGWLVSFEAFRKMAQ
ncbi:MAG: asparagine synthase (glutamine-hydrolyzing) [Balneolaceae bacterium]